MWICFCCILAFVATYVSIVPCFEAEVKSTASKLWVSSMRYGPYVYGVQLAAYGFCEACETCEDRNHVKLRCEGLWTSFVTTAVGFAGFLVSRWSCV